MTNSGAGRAGSRGWIVHKFGGSSLADAECITRVAGIIEADPGASGAFGRRQRPNHRLPPTQCRSRVTSGGRGHTKRWVGRTGTSGIASTGGSRPPIRQPWASRPWLLPIACLLTAAVGLMFWNLLGVGPAAVACSMAGGVVVLRLFDLHVPPALAVALLPFVMNSPTIAYPFSVGIGTLLMTLWFLFYKSYFGV